MPRTFGLTFALFCQTRMNTYKSCITGDWLSKKLTEKANIIVKRKSSPSQVQREREREQEWTWTFLTLWSTEPPTHPPTTHPP